MKNDRWKQHITIYSFIFCVISVILVLLIYPRKTVSESERRRLAKKPELTLAGVLDQSFMEDTEHYLLDHFPFRESLRRIKAYFAYHVLQQKENNDIYVADGYASRLEYPLNEVSVERLADKMSALKQQYFPNQDTWYAIVPDKNYFLAEQNGYPAIDYTQMESLLARELQNSGQIWKYIDIFEDLAVSDYYRTDTHWRQERLFDTAAHIGAALGVEEYLQMQQSDFVEHEIQEFYGVYYGQAALPMDLDTLIYLTNETTDSAYVWNLEDNISNNEVVSVDDEDALLKPVYRLDKLTDETSLDKYDVFLGGASSIQTIRSPKAANDRKLILFRDSYASSLAPLLLEAYSEITLVDIRYVRSSLLGQYIDFSDADILFLYSTAIVNNVAILK